MERGGRLQSAKLTVVKKTGPWKKCNSGFRKNELMSRVELLLGKKYQVKDFGFHSKHVIVSWLCNLEAF